MSEKINTWSLDELMPSSDEAELKKALAELDVSATEIEQFRAKLTPDISQEDFMAAMHAIENFYEKAHAVEGYGGLWFSGNTQDQNALAFMGQVEQAMAGLANRTMFFSLWWRALDEQNAQRLMDGSGDLRYHLYQQRLFSKHTLSEAEEKIITLKDVNGSSALSTLYDMITNKFTFDLEVDGKKQTLTRDALMAYARHPSPEIRKAVYKEQFRIFSAEDAVLGQIYTNRVRDWSSENVDLRSFTSPISVRNLANDIPNQVIETLMDVCKEQAHIFHKFFKLKANKLGVDKLKRTDLYAPVTSKEQEKIPWDSAVDTVLESFGKFSPKMQAHAQKIFDTNHIDAEPRVGKRGGAFCYSVSPKLAPWVLLNYTQEPRQVATLAHELGHAIHSLLASEHSILTFHSALPLAETASVFSEMLLTDRLISEAKDAETRSDILFETIDNIYATVLRQAFFVLFERDAHKAIMEGRTVDELSDMYMDNLSAQFGDSVEVDPMFRHEWISIPHIYHTPFYCYAYSFGMLLSLSLYSRYKSEGESFVETFIKILTHGGSLSPNNVLSEAGIDMTDADFWRSGFKVIEEMVDKLQKEM